MKIASLETGIVLLPNDEPLAGFSENPNAKNPIVWLKLRTDDGIEGLGVTYFGGALTRTLRHAVDELGALIVGEDPLRVEAVAQKLRNAAGSSGPGGILTMAMSAIDVALWDIKGKALGLPLWKLLGGGRDRIRTYASGALRRGLKLGEAVTAAGRLREKGYRQTKMQLGLPGATSPAREIEQARLIREAVGPDMDLMCDINQRWCPEQAIDIGRRAGAERPHGRRLAAPSPAVGIGAAAEGRHARHAERPGPRSRIRRSRDREVPRLMADPPKSARGHPAAGLHTKLEGRLDYKTYLRLDQPLSAQEPLASPP